MEITEKYNYLLGNIEKLTVHMDGKVLSSIEYLYDYGTELLFDFGDYDLDLRLYISPPTSYHNLNSDINLMIRKMNEISSMKILYVEISKSVIYIEELDTEIPVLLSRSLDSYIDDGIYIHNPELRGKIFNSLDDIGNHDIMSIMLEPLALLLLDIAEGGYDTVLRLVDYSLCYIKMPDGYIENGYNINYKVSYIAIGYEGDMNLTLSSIHEILTDTITEIVANHIEIDVEDLDEDDDYYHLYHNYDTESVLRKFDRLFSSIR